jgi:starvation-inducible outer membrane lipoprotein
MKKTKTLHISLFCLLLAGCSSAPAVRSHAGASERSDSACGSAFQPGSTQPVQYHYETEYFDAGTKFLTLVPDNG